MNYDVRYVHIPARDIINVVEQNPQGRERLEKKNQFYSKLEKSILEEGFRNPILVVAGFCPNHFQRRIPKEMWDNQEKVLACFRLGGSRLFIAQKNDLVIPCVVSDFIGRFNDAEQLHGSEAIMSKFKDRPSWVQFNDDGVYASQLDQYHLRKTYS